MSRQPDDAERIVVAEARDQIATSARKVRHCLGQLDDDQVWWRPHADLNSIGNLLLHLAGNLDQRVGSLIAGDPDHRDRPAEFAERGPIPRAELLRRFDAAVARTDEVLAALTPDRLHEHRTYPGIARTYEGTVLAVVFRTTTHLIGHAQEIIFMTRAQLGDRYRYENPASKPEPTPRG